MGPWRHADLAAHPVLQRTFGIPALWAVGVIFLQRVDGGKIVFIRCLGSAQRALEGGGAFIGWLVLWLWKGSEEEGGSISCKLAIQLVRQLIDNAKLRFCAVPVRKVQEPVAKGEIKQAGAEVRQLLARSGDGFFRQGGGIQHVRSLACQARMANCKSCNGAKLLANPPGRSTSAVFKGHAKRGDCVADAVRLGKIFGFTGGSAGGN